MPQVIIPPVGQSNGDKVIEFIDSVGPTETVYTYQVKQNKLTLTNNGVSPVAVSVNGNTKIVERYETYPVTADFNMFSVQSTTDDTNQINVRTVVFATLDIKDGSISGADLAEGSITDDKLAKPKVDVPAGIQPKMVLGTTLSTNVIGMVGYSQDPAADNLVMYNFGGQVKTADPAADNDAANKKYVDNKTYAATAITSGTFDAARIPTLAQSKITNLTTDLAAKLTATKAAAMADSTATDVAGVVADLNTLLANLRAAGIQAT